MGRGNLIRPIVQAVLQKARPLPRPTPGGVNGERGNAVHSETFPIGEDHPRSGGSAVRQRGGNRSYFTAPFSLKYFKAPGWRYFRAAGVTCPTALSGVIFVASFQTADSSVLWSKIALTI